MVSTELKLFLAFLLYSIRIRAYLGLIDQEKQA